jgi:hypothetical protein
MLPLYTLIPLEFDMIPPLLLLPYNAPMRLTLCLFFAMAALAADRKPTRWQPLFNGKDLQGWEQRGNAIWNVIDGGVLVGQRDFDYNTLAPGGPLNTKERYGQWRNIQAWLYTDRNDFEEFELHVEFWARLHGNGGVSLFDQSRAAHAITDPPDFRRTPAKTAYEIQINNLYPDPHPTGSIYGFMDAPANALKPNQWNDMDIVVRAGSIIVQLNGREVSRAALDPQRARKGPIGLQLHDQFTVLQFRNIRIREWK